MPGSRSAEHPLWYAAREVGRILGISPARVRGYVRAGFLSPARGPRGEYRFSFQDLVLLRTALALRSRDVSAQRVRRALGRLRSALPQGRPLSAVKIAVEGGTIIVHDGQVPWNPESGQQVFDFAVADLARKAQPLAARSAAAARRRAAELDAEDWYRLACELEAAAPADARDAYRRAVELDPDNAAAHVNLGRLLHEAGELTAAEAHYRLALAAHPGDATAAFNLGVALEDHGRVDDAIAAYERAIDCEGGCPDAHYNLARLYEQLGQTAAAVRHLAMYRKLTRR